MDDTESDVLPIRRQLVELDEYTVEGKTNSLIYVLAFNRADYDVENEDDDEFGIGLFTSRALAESCVEELRDKPGFVDYPEGFVIRRVMLNRPSWDQGFVHETWDDK